MRSPRTSSSTQNTRLSGSQMLSRLTSLACPSLTSRHASGFVRAWTRFGGSRQERRVALAVACWLALGHSARSPRLSPRTRNLGHPRLHRRPARLESPHTQTSQRRSGHYQLDCVTVPACTSSACPRETTARACCRADVGQALLPPPLLTTRTTGRQEIPHTHTTTPTTNTTNPLLEHAACAIRSFTHVRCAFRSRTAFIYLPPLSRPFRVSTSRTRPRRPPPRQLKWNG